MLRVTVMGVGLALTAAALAVAAPGDLARVSVTGTGGEAPTGATAGVTSGNGRYVAFTSTDDLAGVPTGGKRQVYVRDRIAGTTRIASASVAGAAANADAAAGDSFNPFIDISADGRYVVFSSAATNLVPGDVNGFADVFRKDMTTGAVDLISVSGTGAQANAAVIGDPSISADGTRIAFNTGTATNLFAVADGNNANSDIALRDLLTGQTTRLSETAAGVAADAFSERPSLSADGRVAAFETQANNLYAGDTQALNEIVVKTIDTGAVVPASVVSGAAPTGANVAAANMPDISGTGRYVVFQTDAKLDPAADTNAANDVYRRDTASGLTTLISAKNGVAGNGNASASVAAVSADGARVAFKSDSTDLLATPDANGVSDVFARTVDTSATVRLSERADGTEVAGGADTSGVSGSGGVGVFTSTGSFSPETVNGDDDVFAKELTPTDALGPKLTVSLGIAGAPAAQLRVTGTVSDPSGVASVLVGAESVRPNADGSFVLNVPAVADAAAPEGRGLTTVALIVADGAGNVSGSTLTFTPAVAPVLAPVARLVPVVTYRFTRTSTIGRMRVTLRARATLIPVLQRRVTIGGKRRFVTVRRGTTRTVAAGVRTVTVRLPLRPRGVYRMVVLARAGTARQIVYRAFVIRSG